MNLRVFCVLAVVLFAALALNVFFLPMNVIYVTFINGARIRAEVASSEAERVRGLSHREGLKKNEGMLFEFDEPREVNIWMKDMKFSIDILWIRDGEIVWIVENAPVPSGGEVASYLPPVEATHVLEVPAGFAQEHGVAVGDALTISTGDALSQMKSWLTK
jgi:uncharacterized membrane protein (UPF0127 family)